MAARGSSAGAMPPWHRPVAIAPVPGQSTSSGPPPMPYACQSCVRRKVKCDRISPICSSCTRAKLGCLYRAPPPPRPRKRKPETGEEDNEEKSAHARARQERHEGIRQEDNAGAVNTKAASASNPSTTVAITKAQQLLSSRNSRQSSSTASRSPVVEHPQQPAEPSVGKLLSDNGKYRYIKSRLWLDAGDIDMRELSEHDDYSEEAAASQSNSTGVTALSQDPISSALLGVPHSLAVYHPSYQEAKTLWAAYVSNVDVLCKILHVPSTANVVESISQQPATASKAQECLIFSIYHSAVLSMTDRECLVEFGQSRSEMLVMYQCAVRQALVNVSWLKTTEMPVMQAYVLFLIAMRTIIDPHTFWILTGVAVRIAQRMGLHRDGEGHGLSPFDVEMRRRLFWQLVPLDAQIGQISGSGISILPGSWDTKPPLNINDDQIYPGMKELPEVQKGATEMIFCLVKAELSNLFTKTGVRVKDSGPSVELKDGEELEELMDEVEATIEMNYLRYCDISSPLHFFTLGVGRSAANTVRLRNRLSPLANTDIDDRELRELCVLAHKILDTDGAIYRNPMTKKFHWQIKSSFLWDALKCVLTSLARPGFYPQMELDATWNKMANFYGDHEEVIEAKGAIQASVARATLDAWRANPPSTSSPEPGFITMLRSKLARNQAARPQDMSNSTTPYNGEGAETTSSMEPLYSHFDGANMRFDSDFNPSVADWMFWGQSTQSHRLEFS